MTVPGGATLTRAYKTHSVGPASLRRRAYSTALNRGRFLAEATQLTE